MPGGVRVAVAGHRAAGQSPVVVAGGDDGAAAGERRQHDGDAAGRGPRDEQGAEHADDERGVARGSSGGEHDGREHDGREGDEERGTSRERIAAGHRASPQQLRPGRDPPHDHHGTGNRWQAAPDRGRVRGVLTVPPDTLSALRPWFSPERPGPLIFEHVARTGHGRVRVDRWPDPRVVLAELPGNIALRGEPDHLPPDGLAGAAGFVEAPAEWLPALRAADPSTGVWDRLVAVLPDTAVVPEPDVRLLTPADAPAFAGLSADSAWIAETWGGVSGLLAAGVARGVLADGKVAALAVPFYVGAAHEDIGVVTEPAHRRRGLSAACAAALVADIRARGRVPTWTTSPDNTGSLAVAARLGFVHDRDDVLYAWRTPIPTRS